MRSFLLLIVLIIFSLVALLGVSIADAYVMNGMLDDWGVTPHVQWVPSQSGVSWIEEDNWGSAHPDFPYGGEVYDVEALYCHVVAGIGYIALVTSYPSSGYGYTRSGDFGIDLDRDGVYEYGLLAHGPHQGGLVGNPIWGTPTTYPQFGPSRIQNGTLLSTQPLIYANSGIMENGFYTYIIEGCFDLSSIGDPTVPFNLHWTMSCGNDVLDLTVAPIPEPGSLLLLGPGLAALWASSRRRRKRHH